MLYRTMMNRLAALFALSFFAVFGYCMMTEEESKREQYSDSTKHAPKLILIAESHAEPEGIKFAYNKILEFTQKGERSFFLVEKDSDRLGNAVKEVEFFNAFEPFRSLLSERNHDDQVLYQFLDSSRDQYWNSLVSTFKQTELYQAIYQPWPYMYSSDHIPGVFHNRYWFLKTLQNFQSIVVPMDLPIIYAQQGKDREREQNMVIKIKEYMQKGHVIAIFGILHAENIDNGLKDIKLSFKKYRTAVPENLSHLAHYILEQNNCYQII